MEVSTGDLRRKEAREIKERPLYQSQPRRRPGKKWNHRKNALPLNSQFHLIQITAIQRNLHAHLPLLLQKRKDSDTLQQLVVELQENTMTKIVR